MTLDQPSMKAVLDYLKQHEQESIEKLCEYLRFPSISAQTQHRKDLHACAEWVTDYLQSIGLKARLCPTQGHPIVLARTRSGAANGKPRPRFLIYGHYDVQPPEPFELWKTPPFEPRIEHNTVFARGACDNKGQ